MHSQLCHTSSLSNMATDELHVDSIVRRHHVYMSLSGSLVFGEEISVELEIVMNNDICCVKKDYRIVGHVSWSSPCIS